MKIENNIERLKEKKKEEKKKEREESFMFNSKHNWMKTMEWNPSFIGLDDDEKINISKYIFNGRKGERIEKKIVVKEERVNERRWKSKLWKKCESCVVKCTPLCKSIETKERELFRTEKSQECRSIKIDWQ